MKFAMKSLAILAAGGLLTGTVMPAPAAAADSKETDIIKIIDSDLKAIDKELFGWLTPEKKK
jgi:hypothetical protein